MSAGLLVGDIPNKVPSLANVLLCAANPEEVPFTTRIKKGKKIGQFDHKYFVEEVPARRSGGATDGQDVSTYGKGRKRYEFEVRGQEFRREYKVGQQTQDVIEDTAVTDQMAKLRLDEGKEILKDVEAKVMGDDVSAADEGTEDKGSRMGGLGYLLTPTGTAMSDKPIPNAIRIPANQRYTGTYAAFTETSLTDILEARRQLCGHSAELVMYCGTQIQRKFDNFENYIPDLASHTVTLRSMDNQRQERKVKRGIRFYEGSFGTVEIVIDDFMPKSKRAHLVDHDQAEWMPMGKGSTKLPLPNLGGGPRELLSYTGAWKPGDVRAYCMIKPSDE